MATKKVTALVELTAPAVGDVFMIVDISEALDVDKNKKISITNIGNMIPTLANLKNVGFASTYDAGDSGAAKTLNFSTNGNIQKVKLTANTTFTFTAPPKPCGLTIYLIGDGTARTIVYPGTAEFVDGGDPPAWGATNNEIVGIISLRYDSTMTPNYIMSGLTKT